MSYATIFGSAAPSAWAQPIGGMFGGSYSNCRFHFLFESINWTTIVNPAAAPNPKKGYGVFRSPFFVHGAARRDGASTIATPLFLVTPASRCTANVARSRRGSIVAVGVYVTASDAVPASRRLTRDLAPASTLAAASHPFHLKTRSTPIKLHRVRSGDTNHAEPA